MSSPSKAPTPVPFNHTFHQRHFHWYAPFVSLLLFASVLTCNEDARIPYIWYLVLLRLQQAKIPYGMYASVFISSPDARIPYLAPRLKKAADSKHNTSEHMIYGRLCTMHRRSHTLHKVSCLVASATRQDTFCHVCERLCFVQRRSHIQSQRYGCECTESVESAFRHKRYIFCR